MDTVKIIAYSVLLTLGAALISAVLLLVFPSIVEVELKLRGNSARYRVAVKPFCLPKGFGGGDSVTYDRALGLVYCGSDKRFGTPVVKKRRRTGAEALLRAIAGSIASSVTPLELTAKGAIAANEDLDKAVLTAGSIRTAAAMLVSACPKLETSVCIAPDFTSSASRIDLRLKLKMNTGRLLAKTLRSYSKSKGDKTK